jgi:hypothetical protein
MLNQQEAYSLVPSAMIAIRPVTNPITHQSMANRRADGVESSVMNTIPKATPRQRKATADRIEEKIVDTRDSLKGNRVKALSEDPKGVNRESS